MFNENNRITRAINDVRSRLEAADSHDVAACDAKAAIDATEHFTFQQAQSRAACDGTLMIDEASVVYRALGFSYSLSNGGWAPGTDTATKIVVTQLIAELLRKQLVAA